MSPTCSASRAAGWCISSGPPPGAACCGLLCGAGSLRRCRRSWSPHRAEQHPCCATAPAFYRDSRRSGSCCWCCCCTTALKKWGWGDSAHRRKDWPQVLTKWCRELALLQPPPAPTLLTRKRDLPANPLRCSVSSLLSLTLHPSLPLWRYCVFYFGNPGLVTPPRQGYSPVDYRESIMQYYPTIENTLDII